MTIDHEGRKQMKHTKLIIVGLPAAITLTGAVVKVDLS